MNQMILIKYVCIEIRQLKNIIDYISKSYDEINHHVFEEISY